MLAGFILFLAWMALEAVVVIGSIIWSIENGEWKNVEKPKFAMLEDREPADWPGREPLAKWEPPQREDRQVSRPARP